MCSHDLSGSVGGPPPEAQETAEESIGAAATIAGQLPGDAGSVLLAAASDAFVQAMAIGLSVAAALAAVTAAVVARRLSGSS
jgi:MFS transporter, DHA2 family, multidrug resistance protein